MAQKELAKDNRAEKSARSTLESIIADIAALREANESDTIDTDQVRERIEEGPLECSVRCSDWSRPGSTLEATEYRILLGWGGPAVQIFGELGPYNQPATASIQYQDWGTPWEDLRDTSSDEDDALLEYVRLFYFGE